NAGGGTVEVMVDMMSGIGALATFGQKLYFTAPNLDAIWVEPTSGGAPTQLITGQNAPSAIAVDGSGIYWTDLGSVSLGDGAVKRADLDGSNIQTLASNQKFPLNIAVDAGHVYWSTLDGGLSGIGKDGKNLFPYVVGSNGPPVISIAADGAN